LEYRLEKEGSKERKKEPNHTATAHKPRE